MSGALVPYALGTIEELMAADAPPADGQLAIDRDPLEGRTTVGAGEAGTLSTSAGSSISCPGSSKPRCLSIMTSEATIRATANRPCGMTIAQSPP